MKKINLDLDQITDDFLHGMAFILLLFVAPILAVIGFPFWAIGRTARWLQERKIGTDNND